MFSSGALPPFTASGLDPQVLLRVPAAARTAMAAATTTAEAYAILTSFDGLTPGQAEQRAAEVAENHEYSRMNWPT